MNHGTLLQSSFQGWPAWMLHRRTVVRPQEHHVAAHHTTRGDIAVAPPPPHTVTDARCAPRHHVECARALPNCDRLARPAPLLPTTWHSAFKPPGPAPTGSCANATSKCTTKRLLSSVGHGCDSTCVSVGTNTVTRDHLADHRRPCDLRAAVSGGSQVAYPVGEMGPDSVGHVKVLTDMACQSRIKIFSYSWKRYKRPYAHQSRSCASGCAGSRGHQAHALPHSEAVRRVPVNLLLCRADTIIPPEVSAAALRRNRGPADRRGH